MKAQQFLIRTPGELPDAPDPAVNLVIGFGHKPLLQGAGMYDGLKSVFPAATIVLCSSAGEIFGTEVYDDSLSVVAISFAHTSLLPRAVNIQDYDTSFAAGAGLASGLPTQDLRHVFILSDGSLVNGSELIKGMHSVIPAGIPLTGGLAGDGADFNYTLVGLNEAPRQGRIAAIGLYGEKLRVAHGSFGGWQTFGLERTVTKAVGNELFEIDGKNALGIYKEYLGKHALELPGSALLFPLSIQLEGGRRHVVRTILGINEQRSSMIFAGDVPVGSKVTFMMANMDRLMDAASTAAEKVLTDFADMRPEVAILISCVGRKLVLGGRVDEEVEAVRDVFGPDTLLTGYYSYGEISPLVEGGQCVLHNQTMTITCFQEVN